MMLTVSGCARAAATVFLGLVALTAGPAALTQGAGAARAETGKPVQEPITGGEDLGDLSQPKQALIQFYKAFNARDLKMIDENFSSSDDVAIDNPLGGIRRGADQPHKMYQGIFASPADVRVEFWDYTIDRVGDVFWAVGRERGAYRDGDVRKPLAIRTTRIFRLESGRWRQVHHHGSIEDPKLLEDYQRFVKSLTPSDAAAPK
jgi:ketosteroid isomerase-like protein